MKKHHVSRQLLLSHQITKKGDSSAIPASGRERSFFGEFMKDHRQSVALATKYFNSAPGTDPNAAGNHRKREHGAEKRRKETPDDEHTQGNG